MENENQYGSNEFDPQQKPVKQKENIGLLLSVFMSPVETYKKYKENPKFAWKLVIILLLSAMLGALSAYVVFSSPELQELEGIEELPETLFYIIGLISGFFGGGIAVGVSIVITCFFLWILASITTTDVNFKQLFAIYVVAAAPTIIGAIIQILMMSQGQGIEYAVTSLGFLAQDPTAFASQILYSIELFGIWATILLGIGIAVFAKVSMKKGMILAFIYWGASILVISTIAWFFSNLSFV